MNSPDPISSFEAERLLAWRTDIVNQLIAENPENTIADYAALINELEIIEVTRKHRENNL